MRKVIFVFLLFFTTSVKAQFKKPYFNTLNVASGLPEALIQSSLEDKFGYLWLGTQNGLVRYDGYKLKPYSIPDGKGGEVVNSSIQYLFEDSFGTVWMFVWGQGIYQYDRQADRIIKQAWSNAEQEALANNPKIRVLQWIEDRQDQTHWVAIINVSDSIPFRIFHLNPAHQTLEEYSAIGIGKYNIPSQITIEIKRDAKHNIWLITDTLLNCFNHKTKSFEPFFKVPENTYGDLFEAFLPDPVDPDILWMNTYDPMVATNPQHEVHTMKIIRFNTRTRAYKIFLPNNNIPGALPASGLHIYIDSLKRIWVSTNSGISLYNRHNESFTNYPLDFPFANSASVLASDKEGNLWMGSIFFSGLYCLNTETGKVSVFKGQGEPGDLPSLSGISQLFFDQTGTLWVNIPFGGISYLDRRKSLFAPVPIDTVTIQSSENKKSDFYRIVGNRGDSLCLITYGKGFYEWHIKKDTYKKIDIRNTAGQPFNIDFVVSDTKGDLWFTSYNQGLFYYNCRTKSIRQFKYNPSDSLSLAGNFIRYLLFDHKGILWIGTNNNGICSFNKETGKFTRYPFIINDGKIKPNNALDDQAVISMFFDSDEILWVGTNLGSLNRFDPKTQTFTSYLDRDKGFTCVVSIIEDKQKRLWVGTYLSGLFLFDRKTETFKRYSEKDGLLGNTVYLTEDVAGNIWALNDRGLSRLNPESQSITNFTDYKPTGRNYTLFKDGQGNFHLAGKKGIVSFDPLKLNENIIPPQVVIESVSYRPAYAADADTLFFTAGRQEITLAYNENRISFQYLALHFADAANNKYAYQLEGYDDDWLQAGTQRTATYTNLSPGTYTFKVKAANSDGVWNEKAASFTIIILPPWWKTWWAYILYALMFLGALRIFSKWRERRLHKEKESLQIKVEERTSELKKSLENLKRTQSQLIQSEKMASLGELTAGIAHEIQNPLNFVNNFSEVSHELMDEMKDEFRKGSMEEGFTIADDVKQNLEKIIHHGKRADSIVKGMLQHSRSSSGQKEPTDLNALAEEYLRLAYAGMKAKDKNFSAIYKFEPELNLPKIELVPQDISRVLLNLFNNAFYAVDEKRKSGIENYEPTLSVSTKKNNGKIEIRVADNGNGIPQKIFDKIFQPFFTTKPTGQGTGLGLSLSYDIAKAHGGELKVVTKEGNGTEFIFQLPV